MFGRRKVLTPCELRINRVSLTLEQRLFATYYQKITNLSHMDPRNRDDNKMEAHGLELLNRPLPSDNFSSTEQFYAFVAAHGKSSEVDVFTMKLGFQRWIQQQQSRSTHQLVLPIFVNVHLSTLFSEQWNAFISHFPADPTLVVLELSEREGLDTYTKEDVSKTIRQLKDMGFKIAVDDLGMAYSGLYTLAVVHPDYVKIDRQLVNRIDEDEYRQYMMGSLLEYWRREGVAVIAEGIEREEEANFFLANGATYAQGYWFHRPVQVESPK